MSANPAAETSRGEPADTAGNGNLELTLTRIIDAPRALVWQVWTGPEHARHWGPRGFTIVHVAGDVKPGGAWRLCMRPHDGGRDLWQGGVFLEVAEPERLVYTFAWDQEGGTPGHETVLTVTFEEHDGKTRLTLHQASFASVAARDGHAEGWGEALDSLTAHAEAVARGT